MPYIALNTSQKLPEAKKEKIKAEFGRIVTNIPTKTEAVTMIDFSDDRTMYKEGEKIDGAFVDLRLFKKAEFEAKKKFTEETFEMLNRELGIKNENFYLNIIEFENWGSGATLKT